MLYFDKFAEAQVILLYNPHAPRGSRQIVEVKIMSESKPQWRNWGDHPFVVILSVITGIIAIVIFVRDKPEPGSTPPSPPPAPSIVGVWDQYVKDADGKFIYVGKFVVSQQNGRYSMGAKQWADPAKTVRSVSLYDVTYNGEWWTFKSDWENGKKAVFHLRKISDTIFEGEAVVNDQRRESNRWLRAE